jgi:hypothetical protein
MMADTQVVTNGEVKIWYNTWGSYGQHSIAIAILKDGTVVNPASIGYPPRGMTAKKKVGNTEVRVVNDSSSKNAHIYVYIPADAVEAVVSNVKTSSGSRGWEIAYGDGDIEVVEEKEEKIIEKNGRKFKEVAAYWNYYFVTKDGKKVLFYKERGSSSLIPLDKPKVRLVRDAARNVVYVVGDTYDVKETLKKLGFRWNPSLERWEKQSNGDLQQIAEQLGAVADVSVEERKDELLAALDQLEKGYKQLYEYFYEMYTSGGSTSRAIKLKKLVDDLEQVIISLKAFAREQGESNG